MANERVRSTLEIGADLTPIQALERQIERTFDAKTVEAFERAVARVSEANEKLSAQNERLTDSFSRYVDLETKAAQAANAVGAVPASRVPAPTDPNDRGDGRDNRGRFVDKGGGGSSGGGFGPGGSGSTRGGGRGSFWPTFAGSGLGSYLGNRFGSFEGMGGAIGRGEGMFEQMLGSLPLVGGFASGVVSSAQDLYGVFAQQRRAHAEAFARTGMPSLGGRLTQDSARLGLSGGEAANAVAQVGQTAGLEGDPLRDVAGTALAMQRVMGVDAASLLGAAGTAGGQFSSEQGNQMMAEAISDGFAAGFRASRLDTFVQAVAGMVEDLRTRGISVTPESISAGVLAVRGLGEAFRGEAGTRAFQDLSQNTRGMLDRPGLGGMVALRAVQRLPTIDVGGQTKEGRNATLLDVRQFVEEHPEQALPAVIQELRKVTGGMESGAFLLQELFPSLSVRQAREAISGEAVDLAADRQRGAEFVQRRTQQAPAAFATAARLAGRENLRAGTGGRVAATVEHLQDLEDRWTADLLPKMSAAIDTVVTFANGLLQLVSRGDISGIFRELGSALSAGFDGLTDQVLPEVRDVVSREVEDIKNDLRNAHPTAASAIDTAEDVVEAAGSAANAVTRPYRAAKSWGQKHGMSPETFEDVAQNFDALSDIASNAAEGIRKFFNDGAPDVSVEAGR